MNKREQEDARAVLERMKEESVRMVRQAETEGAKKAWYYSHLGSIDFARQIGVITEEERNELYYKFRGELLEVQNG